MRRQLRPLGVRAMDGPQQQTCLRSPSKPLTVRAAVADKEAVAKVSSEVAVGADLSANVLQAIDFASSIRG